jgi:hypothetical protein
VLGGLAAVGIFVVLVVAIALGEEQTHERRHDVVSAWQESKARHDVHARLGEPTFTTRINAGRRSAPCDVYNAYDSVVDSWVQFVFCYGRQNARIPSPDPLEPNDDVAYLRTFEIPPLTRPGKPSAQITARLDDWSESDVSARLFDTEDVYRVWVPSQRGLRVRVEPTADVDLEVWDASTSSVYLKGADRERHLIASSDEAGRRSEELTLTRRRGGTFVYVDVYQPNGSPNHSEYDLTVTPAARS